MAFWFFLLWCLREPASELYLSSYGWLQTAIVLSFGPGFLAAALIGSLARRTRSHAPVGLVLMYLAWTGLSLQWTQAHSLKFASASYVSFTCEVLAALVMSKEKGQLVKAVNGIIVGACILSGILVLALVQNPTIVAATHMLDKTGGTAINANLFGYRIGMGALAATFLALTGRRRMKVVAFVLVTVLVLTTSKSSIALVFLIGVFYVMRTKGVGGLKIVLAGMTAFVLALPFAWTYFSAYDASESAVNLTGRIPLWIQVLGLIRQNPYFGYGFLSFQDVTQSAWGAMHAHNDYLQQWFTLGIVGFVLFLALYGSLYRRLHRSASPYAALGLMWLAYAVGRGLVDADPVYFSLPLHLLVLLFPRAPIRVRVPALQRRSSCVPASS
jgi:exopolysaccharide production protein ExoQ